LSGISPQTTSDQDCSRLFIERIRAMNRHMNIPEFIEDIKESDIPLMVERACSEANPLYPVPQIYGKLEITELYHIVLGQKPDAHQRVSVVTA
jgi:alcohol dehydrogenase